MCSTTDSQLSRAGGGGKNVTTNSGQSPPIPRAAALNGLVVVPSTTDTTTSTTPAVVVPQPHSPRSSHNVTPDCYSVKSLFEEEDADEKNDELKREQASLSSSASARARMAYKRQRSLIESDDGKDHAANANAADGGGGGSSSRSAGSVTKKDGNNFCVNVLLPAVCQGGVDFADGVDIFTACRHPLDNLLGIFHDDDDEEEDAKNVDDDVVQHVSGYYAIPTTCEYCGSPRLEDCDPKRCQRPRSYFPTMRPPFCKKGKGHEWDDMDFAIVIPKKTGDDDDEDDDEWNSKGRVVQQAPSTDTRQRFRCHVPGFLGRVKS